MIETTYPLEPTTPKYDPCRMFRKGDKVELKEEIDGRKLSEFVTGLTLGKIYTVEEDEKNHIVVINSDNGLCRYSFVHLKLVTPVEKLEPCTIFDNKPRAAWTVLQNGYTFAHYPYRAKVSDNCANSKEEAKAAAEAECARLNAEYRKEQE